MRTDTAIYKRTDTFRAGRRIRANSAVIAAAVFAAAVMSFMLMKTAGASGEVPYPAEGTPYPSSFYHYTGFHTGFGSGTECSMRLSWKKTSVRLDGGAAQIKLSTQVLPLDAENKNVTFFSSDENIAAVDEYGNITALNPGKVTITAVLEQTGQTETAELEVTRPVTGMIITNTSLTLNTSDTMHHMEAQIYPEDATNQNIIWMSKDPSVASVDENGALRPVGPGMTEITAVTEDGGFSAKCFVTVVDSVIDVDSIAIQNKGSGKLGVGESMNMIATISPSNAKNKAVTWESSDEGVATISATGRLKAVAEGTALITVRAANGTTDTMELTVAKADGESALNLYGKVTSDSEIPTDILGSTYIANGSSSAVTVANGETVYTSYDITLSDIVDIQMGLSPAPKIWRSGGTVSASRSETLEYMDPASYCTGAYKYQFLDLSHSNGVSAESLNRFLEGKGILEGMGQAFVDAANENGISEVYLVAHACLETGNGTSTLSTGVDVNGTTVYNMFGIAAYDDSALYSGSQKAYKEGWTSPEAAIKGGAAWISEWYVNAESSRQNTLYKMLWNPETPGVHQYATDIGWAVKQAINIEKIFAEFPEAVLSYDIPVYQGQTAIVIE